MLKCEVENDMNMDEHFFFRFEASNKPYYDFNISKVEKLGMKFKSVEEMFDDCVASFLEQGHLSSPSFIPLP